MENSRIMKNTDMRKPIEEIYEAFSQLEKAGWVREVAGFSSGKNTEGSEIKLPIYCYRTRKQGNSLYLFSGIHGEEPAGVNALAENVEALISIGEKMPVVLFPVCNPLGYALNFRYPRQEKWEENSSNISVGDSEHLLLSGRKPRREKPVCLEADAITKKLLQLLQEYKPKISIDLHEDNLIEKGYIYLESEDEAGKKIAQLAIKILKENGLEIQLQGHIRFGESIVNGIVQQGEDGSIDELMYARLISVNKKIIKKPYARIVLVVESPAKNIELATRVNAHSALIKNLNKIWKMAR